MLLLRVVFALLCAGIGACLAAWVLTRRAAYLAYAWRLFRYGLALVLAFFCLLILERVLLPIL